MKSTLTILAILSIIYCVNGSYPSLSSSHAYNDLLHQILDIVQKTDGIRNNPKTYSTVREIRASSNVTIEGYAYVESDINSCSLPSGSIVDFCGITKSSPTLMVKRQSQSVELIIRTFSTLKVRLGATCSNALKAIICNGGYPECSGDSSTATYKNFASDCGGLSACTGDAVNFNGQTGAQLCRLSGSSINLKTCAKFSRSSFFSAYCDTLPYNITFPTWIVPELSNHGDTITSLQTVLDNIGASSSCKRKWIRLGCLNVPFCSSDRQKILGVITRQDCESAFNCLPGNYEAVLRLMYDCGMFPDQNGQKQAVPPGQGFTSKSHASPAVIGSFLLYAICSFLYYML